MFCDKENVMKCQVNSGKNTIVAEMITVLIPKNITAVINFITVIYCLRRNYYWINSGKGGSSNF